MANMSINGTPQELYRVFDFSGGLNSHFSPHILSDRESSDMLNMVFDERGTIRKRPGVKSYTVYPYFDGQEIIKIYSFAKWSGTEGALLVFFKNGTVKGYDYIAKTHFDVTLKKKDGTAFGTFHSTRMSCFTINNLCYFGNSTDGWFKFDGTSPYNATDVTGDYDVTPAVIGVPKCDYAVVKDNRVFYAGNPLRKDAVYYSQLAEPENVLAEVNDLVNGGSSPSGGGGIIRIVTSPDIQITGLALFQSQLLIFKTDSVHTLSGINPLEDFKLSKVQVATGCVSPDSIVVANNVTYYVGHDGLNYIYSPFQSQIAQDNLSIQVSKEFDMIKNKERIHSVYAGGELWLFYPGDVASNGLTVQGTQKTLMYSETLKAWGKHDINITASYYDLTADMIVMGSTTGYCLIFDDEQKYDSTSPGAQTPIASKWSTKFFHFNKPETTKKFKFIKLFFKPNAKVGSLFKMTVEIDYKESYKDIRGEYIPMVYGVDSWGYNIDPNTGAQVKTYWGGLRQEISKKINFGGSGETIRFTFYNDGMAEDMEIHGFVVGYKEKTRIGGGS